MPKSTYFPTGEKPADRLSHYQSKVSRVWAFGSIEIERKVGTYTDAHGFRQYIYRTNEYDNVTEASRGRLHKAIEKIINAGRVKVSFIYGQPIGLGYEVEL